jgi:hypothetical protein
MNYYYILLVLSFITFGIHNSISSRIKNGTILADYNKASTLLLRTLPLVGYVLLAISLFYKFYWIYSIIIFLLGLFLVPAITIKVLSLIVPAQKLKYLINPYPNTILTYIVLSVLMIVLLIIELF